MMPKMSTGQELFLKTISHVKANEGFSSKPYRDPSGKGWAIGYGHSLSELLPVFISEEGAEQLLEEDLDVAYKHALEYPFFAEVNENCQVVILDMIYNLGPTGFSNFKKMLGYMNQGHYPLAAMEIVDSDYATQVPRRAVKNARILLKGCVI